MALFLHELRSALRSLRAQPGLSTAAILALAFGLGTSIAVLSIVHAALFQPASYPQANRLLDVLATRSGTETDRFGLTPRDFLAYRELNRSFESFGGYFTAGAVVLTGGEEAERLQRHLVTAEFFQALGRPPLLGRTFLIEEEEPGRDRVAVLSYGLWRRRFDSDPEIVGATLLLDGAPYTVVGIMPQGFGARGGRCDLWLPLSFGPHRPADRASAYIGVIGRLRPGVSLQRARADLEGIASALADRFPDSNQRLTVSVRPLTEVMTEVVRPAMRLLLAAAAFLTLITCANVASLQLARGLARRRDLTLRLTLGASRASLIRLALLESLLLTLGGALAGIFLAAAGLRLLPDLRGIFLYDYTTVSINGWVLAVVLGLMTLLTAAVGLLPALQVLGTDPDRELRATGTGAVGVAPRQLRLLRSLVVLEIAAAFVLLVGAGLLIRSLHHLQSVDPGFEPANLLALEFSLPAADYPRAAEQLTYYRQLASTLEALPGVTGASLSNLLPGRGWTFRPYLEGTAEEDRQRARFLLVSPSYFSTAEILLVEGRRFGEEDTAAAPPIAILNRRAAETLFPNRSPLGKRIGIEDPLDYHEIVGVVGNVVGDPTRDQPGAAVYLPLLQRPLLMAGSGDATMTLLVRSAPSTEDQAAPVRRALRSLDPHLPVANLRTVEQALAADIARPKVNQSLVTAFAVTSLLLTAIGILGVLSYLIHRRTTEIGLRMALGADRRRILRSVLREGLLLAALGIALGLLTALAFQRLVHSLLYGISTTDFATYATAVLLLLLTTLLSSYFPARRASRQEPREALRRG